jgi:RND family efflux transporter MFP subunit
MIRKYVLPLIAMAAVGLALASLVAFMHRGTAGQSPPALVAPSQSPYPTFVAGAGIVEASTENIAVGSPVGAIVTSVNVTVGSRVKAGDPLFQLDDRTLRAQLAVQQAALQAARSRVGTAVASLADARSQLALAESVTDKRAISVEDLTRRRSAVEVDEAKLTEAKADVASAEAQMKATETELRRLSVRAPVDGQVLQLKLRSGEFAAAGSLTQPLLLLGSVDPMNVRVDIDENDAWRAKAGAPAVAFLRGNKDIKAPLKFVRFEPYVVPKVSLTGDVTERVDTRVLQAIYSFERGDLPIYVGEQMDVFIQAPGHNEKARP